MKVSRAIVTSVILFLFAALVGAGRSLQGGGTQRVFGGRFSLNSAFNVQSLNGGNTIALTLSQAGGSGFGSDDAYPHGTFSVDAKMPPGYTAGVCTCFFLQNGGYDDRNEFDFEYLGSPNNSLGMTLQTNYFLDGDGEKEQLTSFGFDPAAAFHNYKIYWGPDKTVWYVDGTPIRSLASNVRGYPQRPMKVFFSIWDASQWATGPKNARIPVNYNFAPFTVHFRNFQFIPVSSS